MDPSGPSDNEGEGYNDAASSSAEDVLLESPSHTAVAVVFGRSLAAQAAVSGVSAGAPAPKTWSGLLQGSAAVIRDGELEASVGWTGSSTFSDVLNSAAATCPDLEGRYAGYVVTKIDIHLQATGCKPNYDMSLEEFNCAQLEKAYLRLQRGGFAKRFVVQRRRWLRSGRLLSHA